LPWYAHIVNYLVTGMIPDEWDVNDRKMFFRDIQFYYCKEPELFHLGVDHVYRRCVLEEEEEWSVLNSAILHYVVDIMQVELQLLKYYNLDFFGLNYLKMLLNSVLVVCNVNMWLI